jgi:hypothetical protein
LLFAYMGQSLAAVAMPCFTMGSEPGEMSAAMATMDHSGHQMASAQQAASGGESCCDSDGFCSMSQCQAVVALIQATPFGGAAYAAVHNGAPAYTPLNVSFASLYRPPISR